MAEIQMQARSSSDGQLYTWNASTPDYSGAGFPGPGSPLDVAVAIRPQATGVASTSSAIPAPKFVMTTNDSLSGLAARDGYTPVDGDIGLAVAQTDTTKNGYWLAHSGAFTRPGFYDSDALVEAALGQLSGAVLSGTLGAGSSWFQSVGTTIAGAKTWNKLATPSLLQDAKSTTIPAQNLTQHKGAYINPDSANSRNTVDHDRAELREYGANSGGQQLTTATGTSGSANVTLANAKNYRNGNWLMMFGLGAAHGMSTPSAPTVAVQGATGASTVSVKVVAITSTGGYTAASAATQVTNANATLSETNFVEVWFANVPSAYRYLVYVQFGGSGNWTYFGGVIAHPQFDAIGRVEAMTFRIRSNTPPTCPYWLPSTAPASGRANGLRTQILTGGGTTAITVSPVPAASGAGVSCVACNLVPIEDAIRTDDIGYSTEVRVPRGTFYVTGPLQIRSPVYMCGTNGGHVQANSILLFRDSCGLATYNTTGADQWQPGTHYRLKDVVTAQLRTGIVGCWTLTAIAAGATWGVSGTTEPTWNYTPGGTTNDNGHTWTFQVITSSASGGVLEYLGIRGEDKTIPANRVAVEDDLRAGVQNLSGNGGNAAVWSAALTPTLNSYYVPTSANVNGKLYKATTVSGATAGTEPTWPKTNGATVVDGGVTWTCVDVLRQQGAGFLFATVTRAKFLQIRDFCGSGLVGSGNSYSDGSAVNASVFEDCDLDDNTGHGVAIYGSDGQGCAFKRFTVGQRIALGGSCIVQDNSFYGNTFEGFIADGGARYQNQPWEANVQRDGALVNCYVEGLAGSETDWSLPGIVITGHHAYGFRAECLPRLYAKGVSVNTAFVGQCLDTNTVEHDPSGITYTRQLSGGRERRQLGTGTIAAATLLQEDHFERLAQGRTRHTVRGTSQVVRETAHFDARGPGVIIPELRVGSGPDILSEIRFGMRFAVPTTGVWAPGDWISWNDTSSRLGFKARRWGGLGATARANSTAYVQDDVISTGGLHFVCVAAGTSASSLPAAYAATTTAGDAVTDGTAVFRRWYTAQDPQLMAIPNPWDETTAVTDLDQTIQIKTSSLGTACRDMPAATANRVITLGTSGVMPGDFWYLRQLNNVAFTITINTVDGGSVVMPANTKCWVLIRRTLAGTYTQHSAGTLL